MSELVSLLSMLKRDLVDSDSPVERLSLSHLYEAIFRWPLPSYQEAVIPLLLDDSIEEFLLLAPPGHAKSTLLCLYAAWLLGNDPNRRIIVATHTTTYSNVLLAFVEEIMSSSIFKDQFGNLIPRVGTARWTASEKYLVRSERRSPHPSLLAVGVGSSTIGYRADFILADDLVTQQNSMTQIQRNHLANWYFGSLTKRLDPGGRIVVTGARFYAQDLYSKLLSLYHSRVYKATPEEPLWPERFTTKMLEKSRQQNYPMFQAQSVQTPIDLETSFLKESDLHYYLQAPDNLVVYQGVDLAIKQRSEAKRPQLPNRFALVTAGRDRSGNVYLLDVVAMRASRSQQKEVIRQQATRWKPIEVIVETDAAQQFLFEELVEQTNLPLRRVTSGGISKVIRLAGMTTYFRNKKVLLKGLLSASGELGPAPEMNPLVEEWRNFPGSDDILDATERVLQGALGLNVEPATATRDPSREYAALALGTLTRTVFKRARFNPLFH